VPVPYKSGVSGLVQARSAPQAAAAGAIAGGRRLVGAALFTLALNHKQMSVYWAPAFFAHLLGWALQQRGAAQKVSFPRMARQLCSMVSTGRPPCSRSCWGGRCSSGARRERSVVQAWEDSRAVWNNWTPTFS
jgi:ALG6, ALG8 glycosyltransferase family